MSPIEHSSAQEASEPIIKSGEEIVNEFFDNISSIPGVDPAIAEVIKKLNVEGTISKQAIIDALKILRDGEA